jgi:hypothetical protein
MNKKILISVLIIVFILSAFLFWHYVPNQIPREANKNNFGHKDSSTLADISDNKTFKQFNDDSNVSRFDTTFYLDGINYRLLVNGKYISGVFKNMKFKSLPKDVDIAFYISFFQNDIQIFKNVFTYEQMIKQFKWIAGIRPFENLKYDLSFLDFDPEGKNLFICVTGTEFETSEIHKYWMILNSKGNIIFSGENNRANAIMIKEKKSIFNGSVYYNYKDSIISELCLSKFTNEVLELRKSNDNTKLLIIYNNHKYKLIKGEIMNWTSICDSISNNFFITDLSGHILYKRTFNAIYVMMEPYSFTESLESNERLSFIYYEKDQVITLSKTDFSLIDSFIVKQKIGHRLNEFGENLDGICYNKDGDIFFSNLNITLKR